MGRNARRRVRQGLAHREERRAIKACCGTRSNSPHSAGCPSANQRMCGTKAGFERQSDAKDRAEEITREGVQGDHPVMRVYECPFCKLFHLTNRPES